MGSGEWGVGSGDGWIAADSKTLAATACSVTGRKCCRASAAAHQWAKRAGLHSECDELNATSNMWADHRQRLHSVNCSRSHPGQADIDRLLDRPHRPARHVRPHRVGNLDLRCTEGRMLQQREGVRCPTRAACSRYGCLCCTHHLQQPPLPLVPPD